MHRAIETFRCCGSHFTLMRGLHVYCSGWKRTKTWKRPWKGSW